MAMAVSPRRTTGGSPFSSGGGLPEEPGEEDDGPPVQPTMSFDAETFSETKLRYFAVEFVGTFIFTLMISLLTWTEHYQYSDSFKVVNPGPYPTVSVDCHNVALNASTCEGPISHPLAGSTLPRNYMSTCLAAGLCFICCSMSAPGATILPQFALLYVFVSLKDIGMLLPCLLGQFAGVAVANTLMYFLLRTAIGWQTTVFMMTTEEVQALLEKLSGLNFPQEHVSNEYAFIYTCLSGVMLVFLLTPMLHRMVWLHPLSQEAAKGVAIAVFQAGFGLNGLGSMPNPTQWLVNAGFLSSFGFDVWRKHNYYAVIVPLWAPVLGVSVGALLYRVYMALIYFGTVEIPFVKHGSAERSLRRRRRQARVGVCCP